jgi:hypothetical protein
MIYICSISIKNIIENYPFSQSLLGSSPSHYSPENFFIFWFSSSITLATLLLDPPVFAWLGKAGWMPLSYWISGSSH